MRKGALNEMVVRVVTDLACVRLACLPCWVEVEQGNGFRSGAMGMRPVVQPGPILAVRVQVKGGTILGGGVRCADASDPPTQLYVRRLKFLASLLELVEERARLRNGVGNSNLQLTNSSWGCKVTDNINGVAVLETDERG